MADLCVRADVGWELALAVWKRTSASNIWRTWLRLPLRASAASM